jgi:predicted phage tail protein
MQLNVSVTYELNPTTCAYMMTAKWDKPFAYDQYSVSAVKTTSQQCQDPGPITDTSETQYQFSGLRSGSYLINVRPKNVMGWNYYTYCNTVQLPPVKPALTVEATTEGEQQYIIYSSSCATSVKANNGIGYVKAKQGKLKVNPKGNVAYTLTAVSGEGETEEKSITLTDATPTPVPTIIALKDEPPKNENIFIKIFRFLLGKNNII